jgi:hypothetical protein
MVKQLYRDLVSLGYDGSYNRVAAFARAWKEEWQRLQQTAGRGSFVPLSFAPGEAFAGFFCQPAGQPAGLPRQACGRCRRSGCLRAPRVIDRTHNGAGRTVYDWRHYLAVIQRKPGVLRNGAPFLELPEAFKRL